MSRYNKAVQAIEKFESKVDDLGINIHDKHRFNSIVNAIECNVEHGKTNLKIIEKLCDAFIEAIKLLPKDQEKNVKRLFRKCEKIFKDPSNWKEKENTEPSKD